MAVCAYIFNNSTIQNTENGVETKKDRSIICSGFCFKYKYLLSCS